MSLIVQAGLARSCTMPQSWWVFRTTPHEGLFSCQPELIGLFETLVNVIFYAKDLEGRYVEVNSALVRRTGRSSKGEVIGTTAATLHRRAGRAVRGAGRRSVRFGRAAFDELELIRGERRVGLVPTYQLPVEAAALIAPWSVWFR